MTSKGVEYYLVNSSTSSLHAEAKNTNGSWALAPIAVGSSPMITKGNCQITLNFGLSPYGSFSFSTTTDPAQSFEESINAVTGNTSGPLDNMMNTPSIIGPDFAFSYGMFDAGTGSGTGLTNQDQIYAYLTGSQQSWMGTLASTNPAVKNAPFASFVLPGAHDAGMFDLTQVNTLCNSATGVAALVAAFLGWIPGATILSGLAAVQLKGVIIGEAVTQKDNIQTMLNLGCRYFDFRPGYAPSQIRPILDDIYHIHNVIPGQQLDSFFKDVLAWLVANPSEIVVISLGTAGFNDHTTMDPSAATLQTRFAAAQQSTNAESIQVGSAGDLATRYADLIQANKRLFFLNQPSLNWNPATKYDSYSDAYETTDPQVIMDALKAMTKSGQTSDYTVLQLQATATGQNVVKNVIALADSMSNAYNPLMSTKPMMDSNTYPWLLENVTALSDANLLVLLNDFVDNALSGCVASVLTAQRCAASQSSN
ncbi:hypothetical protein ACQZ6B_05285 [Agrobacterium vitis]